MHQLPCPLESTVQQRHLGQLLQMMPPAHRSDRTSLGVDCHKRLFDVMVIGEFLAESVWQERLRSLLLVTRP
ncbi:hypothetical protein WJX79_009792 [Trebouxia sp. C0005]